MPKLQWRAGQLPGQTAASRVGMMAAEPTSMEGRAIARPNAVGRGPGQCRALRTSMEGRAIARPNCGLVGLVAVGRRYFNGGPGNCPAKRHQPRRHRPALAARTSMEGRAIARPNVTVERRAVSDHGTSMEGRAIARPNSMIPPTAPRLSVTSMEGRAIARPNDPYSAVTGCGHNTSMEGRAIARPNLRTPTASSTSENPLQWRAGQLPGQTRLLFAAAGGRRATSMEGRAIARPNQLRPSFRSDRHRYFNGGPGNCPAKHHGDGHVPGHRYHFNGGPGNCPAKHSEVAPASRC